MTRWFRVYDEMLDDPKVQMLSPELFKAWVNLLALASRNGGVLPEKDQIAFALRASIQDTSSRVDDLIMAGLIDILPTGALAPHNWSQRQWKSDDSGERVRKFRASKRARNGDVTVTVTPPEPDTETESTLLPSESDAVREKGRKGFKFDFKGVRGGEDRLDALAKRAEGLGLPVAELRQTLERNRPEKPEGYFLGMCVKRLKDQIPEANDGVLRAAMNGRPKEYTLVTALLLARSEAV
jgi:hypothetical protein